MNFFNRLLFIFLGSLLIVSTLSAQKQRGLTFMENADTLHKGRLWTSSIIGASLYTGAMIGLNQVWYANYPRSRFHFFNDMGEWQDMDKVGHSLSAYKEANWVFDGALWTGMKRRKAMWLGVIISNVLQGSVETLDGFSAKWGFSLGDIGFNMAGSALFVAQELAWREQRIIMKYSSQFKSYPNTVVTTADGDASTTIRARAKDLYGSSFTQTFIKDYNIQTYWLSFNIHSFLNQKENKFPKWLNVAVGYGAENMLGGFDNTWEEDGHFFSVPHDVYPRHRQFYLSLDIDMTRIKIKNRFLRSLLYIVNIIKIPSPTLEINTLGKVKFHPVYF